MHWCSHAVYSRNSLDLKFSRNDTTTDVLFVASESHLELERVWASVPMLGGAGSLLRIEAWWMTLTSFALKVTCEAMLCQSDAEVLNCVKLCICMDLSLWSWLNLYTHFMCQYRRMWYRSSAMWSQMCYQLLALAATACCASSVLVDTSFGRS